MCEFAPYQVFQLSRELSILHTHPSCSTPITYLSMSFLFYCLQYLHNRSVIVNQKLPKHFEQVCQIPKAINHETYETYEIRVAMNSACSKNQQISSKKKRRSGSQNIHIHTIKNEFSSGTILVAFVRSLPLYFNIIVSR